MDKAKNLFSLESKVAVITGGAGILGSAIARGFGEAGATVVICDIKNAAERAEEIRDAGITCDGFSTDILKREKTEEVRDAILEKYKKVHVLVNAAGGNRPDATTSEEQPFFSLPVPAMEKVIALNLWGTVVPSQVFGKPLAKNEAGGSIINISSMNALRPLTRIPAYSAAKAAVSNFTQWLAVHCAQEYNKNLRVNAIAPGFFLTEQNRYLLLDREKQLTPRGEKIIEHTPMGHFGNPEDLVGICVYLASEASRFVTGTVIPIDGGFSAFSGV